MPPRSPGLDRRKKSKKAAKGSKAAEAVETVDAATPSSSNGDAAPSGLEERGAFAFGTCDRCGWRGPGRRSRDRARKDLDKHVADKPKHASHTMVTGPAT